jgi:uncharacterized integral membrane protein
VPDVPLGTRRRTGERENRLGPGEREPCSARSQGIQTPKTPKVSGENGYEQDLGSLVRYQRGGDVMSGESPVSDTPARRPARVPSGAADLPAPPSERPTGRTRISGVWVGVIIGVVVLVLDLVFIIQNSQSVKVSFFSGSVHMPLGVALLLAAVGGVLLAGIVTSLRIWQLRHRLHQSS